jgi:hypothetical protein
MHLEGIKRWYLYSLSIFIFAPSHKETLADKLLMELNSFLNLKTCCHTYLQNSFADIDYLFRNEMFNELKKGQWIENTDRIQPSQLVVYTYRIFCVNQIRKQITQGFNYCVVPHIDVIMNLITVS